MHKTFFKPNKIVRKNTAKIHNMKCYEFKQSFLEKIGYLYCETCYTTSSPMFNTHHIAYASEVPGHKELHNIKNLLVVCWKCHNRLHNDKKLRNVLVEERGLNKLFGKNLTVYDKNKHKTFISEQSVERTPV